MVPSRAILRTRSARPRASPAPRAVQKARAEIPMYDQLLANLAILVLAGFVGFAVISKVPNTFPTPLMSRTNPIHGISVLAALTVLVALASHAHLAFRTLPLS